MPEPTLKLLELQLHALQQQLDHQHAHQLVRNLLARYMQLCDVPLLAPPADGLAVELGQLFCENARWEGHGRQYKQKFGQLQGRTAIVSMLLDYLPPAPHFAQNAHLLSSEHLVVNGQQAEGQWLMQQISTYADGRSELIIARLQLDFRFDHEQWRISRFRTERLFNSPLPADAAALLSQASS